VDRLRVIYTDFFTLSVAVSVVYIDHTSTINIRLIPPDFRG